MKEIKKLEKLLSEKHKERENCNLEDRERLNLYISSISNNLRLLYMQIAIKEVFAILKRYDQKPVLGAKTLQKIKAEIKEKNIIFSAWCDNNYFEFYIQYQDHKMKLCGSAGIIYKDKKFHFDQIGTLKSGYNIFIPDIEAYIKETLEKKAELEKLHQELQEKITTYNKNVVVNVNGHAYCSGLQFNRRDTI